MTTPDLTPEPSDARDRLLAAAEVEFAERGYDGATIREITRRAGTNIAAINYYFGDKERLYVETVKYAHSCATGGPLPTAPEGATPVQRLEGFIRELVRRMHAPARPTSMKLVMREMADPGKAVCVIVDEFIRPMAFALREHLRAVMPGLDEKRLLMTGFSVIGQCLFYRQNRPVAELIFGKDALAALDLDAVAGHVVRFTLAALGHGPSLTTGGDVMNWVALKMLTGDRTKYFGIVFGVSFAALLMAQQGAIFCGLMRNTTSQIRDIQGADLWVMDKNVQFIDDVKPLSENDLYRVRGVPGVKWAVRLYKGLGRARLTDGNFQQMIIIGLDNATLVAAPAPWRVLHGNIEDLRQPDAVFIDEFGWRYLFGNEPFAAGVKTLELNDRRAVIVGMCECSPTFQTFPILYCTYSQAVQFIPQERKTLSFVLAKAEDDVTPEEVGRRIGEQTGHKALTDSEFVWTTIGYYLKRTGIPINFGITVALGFVVGCAIAGQTFYLFTIENLKQFGALKAMGVGNLRLVGMILLQAAVVGVIGYGIGVGGVALFGYVFERVVKSAPPAFYFPWQILAMTAVAVAVIVTAAALVSMRRVLFLEAGVVFR